MVKIIQYAKEIFADAMSGDVAQFRNDHEKHMAEAREQNAYLAIVIMSVMSLVVGSTFLYIGLFVNVTVYNAIPTGTLTAADNTTLSGIKTNVNTAFTLGGIIMIVIGAVWLIYKKAGIQ